MQNRLSDSGLEVLRRNMKTLNDKIALLNQENALMKDKVEALEKENGDLKKSIMQYNKSILVSAILLSILIYI
jgi:peptidoglycan hydrolase CwlO-like protein